MFDSYISSKSNLFIVTVLDDNAEIKMSLVAAFIDWTGFLV